MQRLFTFILIALLAGCAPIITNTHSSLKPAFNDCQTTEILGFFAVADFTICWDDKGNIIKGGIVPGTSTPPASILTNGIIPVGANPTIF